MCVAAVTPPTENREVAPPSAEKSAYDLKYVSIDDECSEGAWYRELPDASIEVMSHARLQRVPLGTAEPEDRAREVASEIAGDASKPKSSQAK